MPDFGSIWTNTPVDDRGGDDLPPGKYVAKITSANTRTSKAGNYGVVFRLVATEGPNAGDSALFSAYLTDKSAAIFVEALSKLGISGDMLDADDEAAIQTAVGQVWGITVAQQKNNADYVNVYLNKRADGGDTATTEETSGATPTPPAPSGDRPF